MKDLLKKFSRTCSLFVVAATLTLGSQGVAALVIGTGQSVSIAFDADFGQSITAGDTHVFEFEFFTASSTGPYNEGDTVLFELLPNGGTAVSSTFVASEGGFGPYTEAGPLAFASPLTSSAELAGVLKATMLVGSIDLLNVGPLKVFDDFGEIIASDVSTPLPDAVDPSAVPEPSVIALFG